MGRNKTLVKSKKIGVNNVDTNSISTMFEQMTGMQNADPEIIIPKILNIKNKTKKFYKLFNLLLNFKDFITHFSEYDSWFNEIKEFINILVSDNDVDLNYNYEINDKSLEEMKIFSEDEINEMYNNLKSNIHIKEIIITSSILSNYKRHIEDINKLDDSFIYREPGLILNPLSFSQLNLKILWISDKMNNSSKKYILSILSHTYSIGIELYEIITSPNVNIKEFSNVIIESITNLRKQVPRCDKAFDMIEDSVKLLENNFTSYYRNSVEAENPSLIIESFIIDVSAGQKVSPVVTGQFKRIVLYLKQKSSGINDPKIKKIFSMLNSQFNSLDAELKKYKKKSPSSFDNENEDDEYEDDEYANKEENKEENEEENEEINKETNRETNRETNK